MSQRYIESHDVLQYVGHEAIADPLEPTHLDVPVEVDSEWLGGEQTIHLTVASTEAPTSTILVPVSWSDSGKRPFHAARLGTMAHFGNAKVIGLDFPGMGDLDGKRGYELTEKQSDELYDGRMQDLARQYWRAMAQEKLLDTDLPMVLWLHSMSALTGSELAASDAKPEDVKIQDLVLSEDMALRAQSPLLFGLKYLTGGGKHLKDYQKLNEGMPAKSGGIGGLIVQAFIKQRPAHIEPVTALARGRQFEIVSEAYERAAIDTDKEHGTRIHMIQAEDGMVETVDLSKFNSAIIGLGSRGLTRIQQLAGEGHGYQDGLPCVLDQMRKLAVIEATR